MENIQYPAPKQQYKVLVRCFTFNHSKYIEDALNGFAMQQTNFPFVCLVMDDASTDGEQEVIKKWMSRECDMSRAETIDIPTSIVIIVPHKTNPTCTFAFYLLKQNLYRLKDEKIKHVRPWRQKCVYEAMCEGDDYWTDPLKLKTQVDFLDNHNDFTMCFHNAVVQYEDSYCKDHLMANITNKEYSGIYVYKNWIIPTASVLYKINVLETELYTKVLESTNFIYGDTPLFVTCAEIGKIYGMSDVMSVYRKHLGGLTSQKHSLSDFRFYRHQEEFYRVFGKKYYSPFLISHYYISTIYKSILKNRWRNALIALQNSPYRVATFLTFFTFPVQHLYYRFKYSNNSRSEVDQ